MQVDRARYTPSDIGPSPSDWGAPRLSEVATLITNGFVGTASPFYSNETGVSYLYGTNVRANKIDLNNLRYITREFHQDQQKTSLRTGDLLTVQSGHIGETAVVPEYLENANCHALIVTRLKPKLVNSDFLCQYINSEIGIARLRGLEVGSTIAHINTKDLKKFRIPLPPLPEQKKIAAILSTWDRAIEGTEKLLANSQQQKKALMQQLLTGKKRLPGFSGEWKMRTLGEIGEISSAGVDKKSVDGEEPVRLLNFTDVFKRTFIYSDDLHQWVTAPTIKVQKCNIKKGDVFFTPSSETRNDIAFSAVAAENMQGCCYSYHVVRLRFKEKWDDAFKAFIFSTMSFRKQVYKLADGSGQRYVISQDDFRSIEVSYPSLDEQRQIGALLHTAENEITALESDLSRLRQEKKALMQQLLTGKRRVTVD